jgi:sugar transferase EpsL
MLKRLLDISVAGSSLIILFPLLLTLAFLIFFLMGRPIFFIQERPGYLEKPFKLLKFRTMNHRIGANGKLLSDAKRLTKFGYWLRSTSFDELPSLWNVFIGDMSLVGPRPLLIEYLPLYSSEEARRHLVKPGITGWAQVNGRNAISWSDKFDLDVWYVDNHTFFLDLKILLSTVKKVLFREGVTESGQVTMSKFRGNAK